MFWKSGRGDTEKIQLEDMFRLVYTKSLSSFGSATPGRDRVCGTVHGEK